MKQCVACRAETTEQKHEFTTADVCPEGHGMWLDQRELLNAVRTVGDGSSLGNSYEEARALRLAGDRDIEAGDDVRDCPMCERPMGSVRYAFTSDVVIDVCERHGVWLDAGELDQLEAWAEQRADPDSEESKARNARQAHIAAGTDVEYVEFRISTVDWIRSLLSRRA